MGICYVMTLICTLSFVHDYSCELVLDTDTLLFVNEMKLNMQYL